MTVHDKKSHPTEWRLEEAKARFSQVVELALNGTPQRVTRRGKDAVVVVSVQQWEAANGKGLTGLEMLRTAPKLTEEEFAEFERHLDRKQWSYREPELDFE